MTKEEILEVFKNNYTKSDVCRKLGYNINGSGMRTINNLIKEYNINIDHFDPYFYNKKRKIHNVITKVCPVCNETFETMSNVDKTTCSMGCSNTYFRSGKNNGNYKDPDKINLKKSKNKIIKERKEYRPHRRICFEHHKKECIICGETLVVAAHHYDENHNNNDPKNLVPLCPTHHIYIHSKHKYIIEEQVNNFINSISLSACA